MNGKEEYDFSNARQGPLVQPLPGKTQITIRIDTDILDWFRGKVHEAGGGNYQTFINDALQEYIHNYDERLESTMRRVIREELQTIAKQHGGLS
ncbi:MAG: BrnA antitoxin family protein [Desulfobacteraceae bacterium]|nr:BrnA antitoxin family protein [Desulfobacteraceae bacterium]